MKARKTKQPVVWVEEETPLEEALNKITDEWIEAGNYCEATISTLRDACKWAVGRAAAAEKKAREKHEERVRCSDWVEELEAARNLAKEADEWLERGDKMRGLMALRVVRVFLDRLSETEPRRSSTDDSAT